MFSYIYSVRFNPWQLGTVHASVVCNIWYPWLKCVSHDSFFAVLNTVSRGSLSRSIRNTQVTNFRILLQRACITCRSFCCYFCLLISLFAGAFDQSVSTWFRAVARAFSDDATPSSDRRQCACTFVNTRRTKQWTERERLFSSCCSSASPSASDIILGRDSGAAFSVAAATLIKVHPILSVPSCARRYSWKPWNLCLRLLLMIVWLSSLTYALKPESSDVRVCTVEVAAQLNIRLRNTLSLVIRDY